jgi:ketosteroid isomerase-like protein
MDGRAEVLARLVEATNDHDLEAMLDCFKPDYRSEQPAHPARAFQGVEQVRKNWSSLMESVPDLHWEVLRTATDETTAWMEARLTGTKPDGTKLDEVGVVILGISGGHIGWGRLYLEDVEVEGGSIDETVRDMTGREA